MKKLFLLPFILLLIIAPTFVQAQKDSTGFFTSYDKTKIYYEIKGKGKPVLLIHGFTGTGNDWKNKPVYDSLIANGCKVILVDYEAMAYLISQL